MKIDLNWLLGCSLLAKALSFHTRKRASASKEVGMMAAQIFVFTNNTPCSCWLGLFQEKYILHVSHQKKKTGHKSRTFGLQFAFNL